MSSFVLKLIAITTMLVDHIGYIFLTYGTTPYNISRSVGRLAFPIFAFLVIEGFHHTKDIKKYLMRLGIFALISEIPFDLAFQGQLLSFRYQNIFFTLFLGLLLIYIMHTIEIKFQNIFITNVLDALLTIVFCYGAIKLRTDYDAIGILLIVAFYLFRGNKFFLGISIFAILGYLNYPSKPEEMIRYGIMATLSMLFIGFYNGKKGKDIKYIFYIFYPAHLILLYLINTFVR